MAITVFESILRLRRDNDYNYEGIKNTFIPANGEICLIDTSSDGLRAVCGDGQTPFGELTFLDDFILKGYFNGEKFFKNENFSEEIPSYTQKIYIDMYSFALYCCDFNKVYHPLGPTLNAASPTQAGVMKLYSSTGQNTDGTMTQKAISDELGEKVEMNIDSSDEMLILDYNIIK